MSASSTTLAGRRHDLVHALRWVSDELARTAELGLTRVTLAPNGEADEVIVAVRASASSDERLVLEDLYERPRSVRRLASDDLGPWLRTAVERAVAVPTPLSVLLQCLARMRSRFLPVSANSLPGGPRGMRHELAAGMALEKRRPQGGAVPVLLPPYRAWSRSGVAAVGPRRPDSRRSQHSASSASPSASVIERSTRSSADPHFERRLSWLADLGPHDRSEAAWPHECGVRRS